MAALQKMFKYEGDLKETHLKKVQVSLTYPRFSYQYSTATEAGMERKQEGTSQLVFTQELKSHQYHLDIPNTAFTGDSAASINNFRSYVRQEAGRTDIQLDHLTADFAVEYSDSAQGIALGSQTLSAVYLPKSRSEQALSLVVSDRALDNSNAPLVLLNRQRLNKLFNEFSQLAKTSDERLFIALVRELLVYSDDKTGALSLLTDEIAGHLVSALAEQGIQQPKEVLALFKKVFDDLFEFTLHAPEVRNLRVGGTLTINSAEPVTDADLKLYDIELNYALTTGETTNLQVEHIDWLANQNLIENNAIEFEFTSDQPVYVNAVEGFVDVNVKSFEGALLWSKSFSPDDEALRKLNIQVSLKKPGTLSDADKKGPSNKNKKLRGKVLCLNSEVSLKELAVVVQAKAAGDEQWRVVSATTTDATGNFTLAYPYGVFTAAQAVVSLAPKSPASIPVKLGGAPDETIADDFLYLLISDAEIEQHEKDHDHDHDDSDCGCGSGANKKSVPRLPDHEDLINSGEYSQDIGGSCVNLSTPNRTLREYNYHAIVRTSDPDVANYTLQKKADGNFELVGGASKIKRAPVDLNNPISWQDTPDKSANVSLYQAVTVATGHILHYKSEFKSDGYSMGDLLYSLPLAPGQKKQIVVFDSFHKLQGAESQSLSQGERLAAGIIDERDITDQLGGSIAEAMAGSSSAETAGVSAGLGVGASFGAIGGSLGVAGGYSSSNSSASQKSSRNVAQHFGERLRQSIMQKADSYRQQNATVVTTVQEGQHYSAMTEVVANHNHCHALTMMYFEVLRHFAIYQELTDVEECVFVPLLMTNFTPANIYKWRDVLARHLLPVHANTYLQPFSFINRGRAHPYLKGFDAIDRIRTNYANVDFPQTTYDDEAISFIKGDIYLRTSMPRPKVRYDRVKSLPVVSKTVTHEEFDAATTAKSTAVAVLTGGMSLLFGGGDTTKTVSEQVIARGQIFDAFLQLDANYESVPPAKCIRVVNFRPVSMTIFGKTVTLSGGDFFEDSVVDKTLWTNYAKMLGYADVLDMLEYYFKGRLISEWDEIYYNDIAPVLFQKLMESIRIDNIALDLTSTARYKGGEHVMRLAATGTTPLKRKQFPEIIKMSSISPWFQALKDYITVTVDKVNLYYSTPHYHGPLFAGYVGDDLLDAAGAKLYAPENEAEKRNPRKEDIYLAEKLIEHLNSNIEHYNKALWQNLDADRRYMLLDGFTIQVFNDFGEPIGFRSLASVVKNRLMSVVGNSLVFPVAAGYKVSKSYIAEKTEDGSTENVSLLDHYKPLTPPAPYRVSVPSRGVFLEAVQGACNACEKVEENTSQDWTKFTTDEPTPIGQVAPPTPTITDWKAAFKDFAQPIVNIQNAPATPAPGAGLAGLNDLLGKSGVFNDITGLDGNQQNAMRTYLSNQENAKAFAEMAKGMAMQDHNTANSDKIMSTLKSAKAAGAIDQESYGKLVKEHLQQQIDGGSSAKLEQQNAKPSLTDAAVQAASQGKSVKAQKIDPEGNTESLEIEASSSSENILAEAKGFIAKIKQAKPNACWATVATMLLSWKQQKPLTVAEAMGSVGAKYLTLFNDDAGLSAKEKPAFIAAANLVGEGPASYSLQQYIDWLKTYGPLWVTIDADSDEGEFSPHANILTKITGTGSPDGVGTNMTFIDPATGTEKTRSFLDFIKIFEQVVTDKKKGDLFIQVVHFADKANESGEGRTDEDYSDYQPEKPDNDPRRIATEIAAQVNQYAGRPAGTVARQVADYCKAKMANVWHGDGGIVGMIFTGEQSSLIEYLDSNAVPADYTDAATTAKAKAAEALLPNLAATYRYNDSGNEYCVVQFKRETDPDKQKNYFARFAHEICHFILQSSAGPIIKDTRAYLFHPNIAEADRVLGAKAREAFMGEILGRRLNYLVHEELDQVDSPGTFSVATLGKSCYEFATGNWASVPYYKPINDLLNKLSTDQEKRTQIGIWLQNFWTKGTLFENASLDKKLKGEFNLAGEFLKNVSDADFAATESRGIQ